MYVCRVSEVDAVRCAQFTLERHDTTRHNTTFGHIFPRTCWRRRQLVSDEFATCYGQVANLLTASGVGVPTRHVTTLIAVIH